MVHDSWWPFKVFLTRLAGSSIWKEEGAWQALVLHAEETRWHFHVTLSNRRQFRSGCCHGCAVVEKDCLELFNALSFQGQKCLFEARSPAMSFRRSHGDVLPVDSNRRV